MVNTLGDPKGIDEARENDIVIGRHHDGPFNADTVRHLLQLTDRPVTVVPD
jgi:hypothetical protein